MVHGPELSKSDDGKRVVTADGDEIGQITEVRHGTAAVKPGTGLTDQLRSALGWGDTETYRVQSDEVSAITDETVVLHEDVEK